MLSGEQIKERSLIQNDNPNSYRAASYDLTVGRIIAPAQPAILAGEAVTIPAQGMVEVVSAERVKLPEDIAGYTLLKNSLSNQGILAISIGIVDPLYEGLMSSTLINFSRSPISLRPGDPFLRLTFHEYSPKNAELLRPILVSDREYVHQRVRKVRRHFSKTFLDLETTIENLTPRVFDKGFKRWKDSLFWYAPLFAFLLSVFTFLVSWTTAYTGRIGTNREQIKAELRSEMQQQDYLQLKKDVDALRTQLQQYATKPSKTRANVKP
jgi:deoxycytidine triphosphate deaminase